MWFDTHCHLDAPEFAADRLEIMQACQQQQIDILLPAVRANDFALARRLVAAWPGSALALGLHPIYAATHSAADLETLAQALAQGGVQAVGEIGLDGMVNVDFAQQEHFFVAQLQLARRFDLPVVLHVRRAQDQVLKHLRRIRVRGGIAHAFNGSPQQAQAFIDLGFALGLGGAMTFERALNIRRLAASLPETALVLETDAPDIPPAFAAHERNTPLHLPRIAETLAQLRGLSLPAVAALTRANARRCLNLQA